MNIEAILAGIETLPPMPAVAVRLLEAAQDPNADLAKLASLLEKDPAMTANLLRRCNSPFYGLRREVTSVRQAASLLGMNHLVQIALTVLSSRYLVSAQGGYGLAAGALWNRSVVSAIAAELIAQESGYPGPSTAYTAGLLEDIGKIVLARFVEDAMPRIWELVETKGLGFAEAEQQVVGMDHPHVGALLLERWRFPPALVEAVRTHHRPAEASIDPTLARIAHLADAFTMTIGAGLGADGLAYSLEEEALRALGFADQARVDAILETLAARASHATDLPDTGRAG
ncbi:MAG: HDOD domain-containing protein [Deltaproteobacteria bacterium]|nr:HDOD domain-containing protein [Deltaproteobacteria bacterium]